MQKCLRVIILFFVFLSACGKNGDREQIQKARKELNITETGTLQAVNYEGVTVPWAHYDYGYPQVSFLEKEGTLVKQGQVIAQLESSGILKVLNSKKPELAIAQAELNKLKVDHLTALKKLEAELSSAKSTLQMAYIDSQRVTFESSAKKEIARFELLKAGLAFRKIQRKIESTRLVQEEELKIQLARIAQINTAIKTAITTMERYTIRAPAEGMIEYLQNLRTRQKIKVGEQLYSGFPLIGLPDLRKMKIQTSVNETDIIKIRRNQNVVVRLDAFPKMAFDGVVTIVGQICHPKEDNKKIKVFDVEALLSQTHRILKPGMTVSCEFIAAGTEISVDNDRVDGR